MKKRSKIKRNMDTKKNSSIPRQPGYMKNETVILIGAVALLVGFFAGTAFTVYRMGKSPAAKPPGAEQMQAALEQRVEQDPEDIAAWIKLGHIYFDSDQYQKAISAYEKALSLDPKNADVLTDLGVMYRRSGNPNKAVEAFDQAIAMNPRHEIAMFNKGIVLLHDLKDTKGAIEAWESLLAVNPLAMTPNGESVDSIVTKYKSMLAGQGKDKGGQQD